MIKLHCLGTFCSFVLIYYVYFSYISFHSINKDWENRSTAKLGNYKMVERKLKPTETHTDNDNVWKSKSPQVPPTLSRGARPSPLTRPGAQSGSFSTQVSNKKEGQHKNRLQLLMFLTHTQPSAMMWEKSWRYSKSLPSATEGTVISVWGQCWQFATQQPYCKSGKPWPTGPNMIDPCSLHIWKKPDHNMEESLELDLGFPTEEWHLSWRKSSNNNNKKKDASSINGKNTGCFTLLLETQQLNEALCSSEWSESWRCTKHASEQEHITVPNGGFMESGDVDKQDKCKEMSSRWEECWRLVNLQGYSQVSQIQRAESPKCANWTACMVIFNKHWNSDPSLEQNPDNTYNDFSEWGKSWQVTKNMSKPCEEIEKVLKALPPKMEMEAEKLEAKPKEHYSQSKEADSFPGQLKHDIMYLSKRELSKLPLLKKVENNLFSSKWRDSWKTMKNRLRMERTMRPLMSENRGDMKPTTSEWKNSWKFTCLSRLQEPELWQQDWATTPQTRVDWARDQNYFGEFTKNVERSWDKSWRFSRGQHQSEPGQGNARTIQGGSNTVCNHSDDSLIQNKYVRLVPDWQEAWMVSESQYHHDKPSLMQWREAWKWSVFHTDRWFEKVIQDNRMEDGMKIQPLKDFIYLQTAKAKMIECFINQMVSERYPEEKWRDSWKAGLLLNHQTNHYESHGKNVNSTTQQLHPTASEHGSKWGRSFRLANPMPYVERPWVESSPNPCHYPFMWLRENNIHPRITTSFSNNPANLRLWGNSYQFLQDTSVQSKDMGRIKAPVDPSLITTKTKMKRNLYGNIKMDKQSGRKWAGCHLLGKTQPIPKRGSPSVKTLVEDETRAKFFEEWAESWKFLIQTGNMKKMKSLAGWGESWKFLLPSYQSINVLKAR